VTQPQQPKPPLAVRDFTLAATMKLLDDECKFVGVNVCVQGLPAAALQEYGIQVDEFPGF
jgi:hypothetical protein